MRVLENIRNIRNSIDIWDGVWYNGYRKLNEKQRKELGVWVLLY